MKFRFYLLIALIAFVISVGGSDLLAGMSTAGQTPFNAAAGHFEWLTDSWIGFVVMLAPFLAVALICGAADLRAPRGVALVIFAVSLAVLAWFYLRGFQESQQALLDRRWTASALSIGLLPFFVGIPLVVVTGIAAAIAVAFGKRKPVSA